MSSKSLFIVAVSLTALVHGQNTVKKQTGIFAPIPDVARSDFEYWKEDTKSVADFTFEKFFLGMTLGEDVTVAQTAEAQSLICIPYGATHDCYITILRPE